MNMDLLRSYKGIGDSEGFEVFNIRDTKRSLACPGGTILLSYRGSIAHGMKVPSTDPKCIDDIDLIGVVIAPTQCYLGLSAWGSRGTREIKEGPLDVVLYELRKMVSLLLQGNPNVMGILWTRNEHHLCRNNLGQELIKNRHLFAGKHVYNAFAGYAAAQLSKMESRSPAELREYIAVTNELKYRGQHPNHVGTYFVRPDPVNTGEERDVMNWGSDRLLERLRSYQKKGENLGYLGDKRKQLVLEHGYDTKNAAHCIRLLRMCKEFLATGEMSVYRDKDGQELLDIKKGKWELSRVKGHAEELFREVKESRDASKLPAEPDRIGAERLVIKLVGASVGAYEAWKTAKLGQDSQGGQDNQDSFMKGGDS